MSRRYTLGQRCLAYILLVSFFLQSCNNFSNPLIPIKESPTPGEGRKKTREITPSTKLVAQGGHLVSIEEEEGQLTATVEESLPVGFKKIHHGVPVYVEEGTHIEKISQLKEKAQKGLVEITLPSSKHKGYVYVGKRGLPGGMTRDSEEDNQEEGEEVKRSTAYRNAEAENAPIQYINQSSSFYHNSLANPASKNQEKQANTLAQTVEFTSLNNLNYQVFKNISVEMAQEVEKQTGLLIPFQPGKTTTEFVGGRGAFGELRLGIEKGSGKYFGIKIQEVNPAKAQETYDEARLQFRLSGLSNLMPLLDVGEEEGGATLYQVMPLASLGNGAQLANYLQNLKDPAFKEAILLHVSKGILQGIAAMHGLSASMAHLDFKPDNLVIDKDGEVYIIDFGCAALLDDKGQIKGIGKGDRRYFSPERYACMLKGTSSSLDARAIDNWAVGLTLLELSTGLVEEKEDIAENTPNAYLTNPLLAQAAPGSYAEVIKGLLNPDPSKRLSVQEALKREVFQQETRPEVLSLLKEFVQTLQWRTKKAKMGKQKQGLTSVQQLPLPHFAGYASRPQLEGAVINQLKSKARVVACVGIGGVGKTQLLTYVVHSEEIQDMYEHVYWFQLSDQENALLAQYRGLAQELNLVDEKATSLEAKEVLLSWLEKQKDGSILLVFDNGDDPTLLKSFLPKKGCQILVSSRSPNWENKVEIKEFTAEQVKELVDKLLPNRNVTLEQAEQLGEALGYLPLAINQAIALIRQEESSLESYVKSFQEKKEELLQTDAQLFGKHLPHSMVTLYQMQLKKLGQECPEAITLLEYTSLLAPDNILLDVLSQGLLGPEVPAATYKKAQQALLQYALWQEDKSDQYVRMHRLMQEVVRLPLPAEKRRERFNQLATHLDAYNEKVTVLADEERIQAIVPHLEALGVLAEKDPTLSQESPSGNLLNAMRRYYVKPQLVIQEESPQEKGGTQKKAIEVENIFNKLDEQHPAAGKVLLLGGAGAGKSTILNHLYEQWSAGKIWRDRYTHIFRVSLKELLNQSWISKYSPAEQKYILACFIHSCWKGQTTSRTAPGNQQKRSYELGVIASLLEDPQEKEKVLLLVDGYDEIAGLQGSEAYKQIVEAGIFKHPRVLVTSRPNAVSKEMRGKFERQIESQGLGAASINKYIHLQFQEAHRQSLGRELQSFLASNNQVKGMCAVPISLALLCIIWKDPEIRSRLMKGNQQDSQQDFQLGQLYQELMRWLRKRHANKVKLSQGDAAPLLEITDEALLEDKVYKALEQVAYATFTGQGLGKGKEAGTLGIPGKLLEEIAHKQDKHLRLSELIEYGLLKGEGDPNKPLEQVYEFIHLSFQEYLTAAHLCKALGQGQDIQAVREIASWLAHHRHEPKYLMSLKFLAGLVSQSKDEQLVKRFWETVSCNVEGIVELGLEGKVNLFMHLLGQSLQEGKFDSRIPHLAKMQELIDATILPGIVQWKQAIIESGYVSPNLIKRVSIIIDGASSADNNVDEGELSAAAEIIVHVFNKGLIGSREQLFDQLMGFVKLQSWQLQKLGLEKAEAIMNKTISAHKLEETVKSIIGLLLDSNLQAGAGGLLAKIGQINLLMVLENLKPLLADENKNVRSGGFYALNEIVKILPQEAAKEVFNLFKPLLADNNGDFRISALTALGEIVKVLPQELVKEALNLAKPLLADKDGQVRTSALYAVGATMKVLTQESLKEAFYALEATVKVLLQESAKEALILLKSLMADTNEDVRRSVVGALCAIVKELPDESVKEALNLFKPLLAEKRDLNVHRSAIYTLQEIAKGLPIKEGLNLFKPLLADEDRDVRSMALLVLDEIVKELPSEAVEEALNLFKPLLADNDQVIRKNAFSALKRMIQALSGESVKEAFNLFKPLLADGESDFRSNALDTLRGRVEVLFGESVNLFKPMLAHEERDIRRSALAALKEIVGGLPGEGVKEALNLVTTLLTDSDKEIRNSALATLKGIVRGLHGEGVEEAFNFVKPLLADSDKEVRSSALYALQDILEGLPGEMLKEAFNLVKPLYADSDKEVRWRAVYALQFMVKGLPGETLKEVLNSLEPLLFDENVQETSFYTLRKIATREIAQGSPGELVEEAFNLVKPFVTCWYAPQGALDALAGIVEGLPGEAIQEAFNLVKPLLAVDEGEGRHWSLSGLCALDALCEIVKVLSLEGVQEAFNLIKPLLAYKYQWVRGKALNALREIVKKGLPSEGVQEAFNLVKSLLDEEDKESALEALSAIINKFSFAEVASLLADDNLTVRTRVKESLAAKFKLAEETSELSYKDIASLLKIMAATKAEDQEIDKYVYTGAYKALQHLATKLDQKGIAWVRAEWANQGVVQEQRSFLKTVMHQALSDGVIEDEEANFIIWCIVEKGITATFDLPGNQITLEDTGYPLQSTSRPNLQRIVDEVIKLSQDPLARQYRDHEPLFVNSGSALPIAKEDVK